MLRGALSQQSFAEELGVSFSAYQNYEHGRRVPPDHVLATIEKKYGVPKEWVLSGKYSFADLTELEDIKELVKIEKKQHKTHGERIRLEEIYEKAFDTFRERTSGIEIMSAPDVKAELEKWVKYISRSDAARLLRAVELLEPILREGDRKKIEALEAVIKALSPEKEGEKRARRKGNEQERK